MPLLRIGIRFIILVSILFLKCNFDILLENIKCITTMLYLIHICSNVIKVKYLEVHFFNFGCQNVARTEFLRDIFSHQTPCGGIN